MSLIPWGRIDPQLMPSIISYARTKRKLHMMNTKQMLGLGCAALSLLAVTGANAAVSTTPDPTLSLVFDTDGSTQTSAVDSTGTTSSRALGVGYDLANTYSAFANSATFDKAQSVFNPLITDTSAAGAFTTLTAGTKFQLALHADGLNNAAKTAPATLFASLFNYNPTATGKTIPIGSAVFQGVSVDVFNPNDQGIDHTYFSSTFALPNAIVSGNKYVLAVYGGPAGGVSPTSFATVDRGSFGASGLPTSDASIYRNFYLIDNNSGDTGGVADTRSNNALTTLPLAYRFYAASPASAAPEPSAVAACSFFAFGLGGMLLVARKRHAASNSAA